MIVASKRPVLMIALDDLLLRTGVDMLLHAPLEAPYTNVAEPTYKCWVLAGTGRVEDIRRVYTPGFVVSSHSSPMRSSQVGGSHRCSQSKVMGRARRKLMGWLTRASKRSTISIVNVERTRKRSESTCCRLLLQI